MKRACTHKPIYSVSLVIPFYNEEESIDLLHERLIPVLGELQSGARVQLILVDDGSTDATFELLHERFGREGIGHCEILQHPANRGIAAAMRTGLRAATGEIICTMDCDCTYAPEELIGLIRLLRESHADIATGSPYHPAVLDAESSRRLFLSRYCSTIYRILAPEKLYCYTSFFRAYRREWTRSDMFVSDGFLGVTEILLAAAYCGANIVEYPSRLGSRQFGRSKMRTLQVIREHLQLMTRTMLLNLRLKLGALRPARAALLPPAHLPGDNFEAVLGRLDFLGTMPRTAAVEDDLLGQAGIEHAGAA